MKNSSRTTRPGKLSWLLKMAWRDGKASSRKLFLFMASIILGIAAVVSIQSFGENLKENIALQSKSLMGADFIVDADQPPNDQVKKIMDSLGGADAQEINFASMVAFPRKGATKLVQVRGIEGGFPFYGEIETQPPSAGITYQENRGALVDATVMTQFGIEPGDSIKVGNILLPIEGALKSVPGSTAVFSSVAPPVIIPYSFIEETGLVQRGSRVEYNYYFVDPSADFERLDDEVDDRLDAENADLDTHTSTSERLGRRYENFGKFLNLIAFIALLLGCVGIASAIHIYIKGKLGAVAVLKCLGATRKQTFFIYLLQIGVIGFLAAIVGTVGGLFLQQLFPLLLEGFLPVEIEVSVSLQAILVGLLLGIIMSVLFALYPLMGTLYVSPLQALRVEEGQTSRSRRSKIMVYLAIFTFIFLFSFWLLEDIKYSLSFVAGIIVTFAILAAFAHWVMIAIKRFFPTSWGFVARLSLLNLFRPQNQTLILVLAIGVGTFLISTLYFTKDLLLAQASLEEGKNSPNMILLDVQSEQEKAVEQVITGKELPVISDIPIVTMRVENLKGVPVNQLREDTTSQVNRWILNHEFRVTYRDSLIDSETLLEGELISDASGNDIIPVSVSEDFAEEAEVGIGDEIVFNVQGMLMQTQVSSIRSVDWARMQLNFSLVFPRGVLEQAPQFRVLTTKVPDEEVSAELQQVLVQQFPNITIIDLRQVLSVIEDILSKISWLVNFMAFFSILTGIIVLIGAVRVSKYQRVKESVLLRTIGARSNQIFKVVALEYFYLGVIGSLLGVVLSLVASQLLAWFLFETTFSPSWMPFLVLFPGITFLVLLIGVMNSTGVMTSPPLQVLRKEGR